MFKETYRAQCESHVQIPQLEESVLLQLIPRDPADEKSAILEVRAGTGGNEASLFAEELFNMYRRYAQARRWKFEPIEVPLCMSTLYWNFLIALSRLAPSRLAFALIWE